MEHRAPSLEEFRECCRREFDFLLRHGFAEVVSTDADRTKPFQVTFARNEIKIVIAGEGYGTVASVTVFLKDGRRIGPAQLLPDFVPRKRASRQRQKLSQLEQISRDAAVLRLHGAKIWSDTPP
jgi:hypothetical protein